MARLAIRATGDKSTREKITAANYTLTVHLYEGNSETGILLISDNGHGEVTYTLQSKEFGKYYTKGEYTTFYNVAS